MPTNIDDALQALSSVDDHQALDGIEDRVLARIDAQLSETLGVRMMLSLGAGALVIGAASGGLPTHSAPASAAATFAGPGPLAPSSLLLRDSER